MVDQVFPPGISIHEHTCHMAILNIVDRHQVIAGLYKVNITVSGLGNDPDDRFAEVSQSSPPRTRDLSKVLSDHDSMPSSLFSAATAP